MIYFLQIFATKFSEKVTKRVWFQSAINYLYIGIIFILII